MKTLEMAVAAFVAAIAGSIIASIVHQRTGHLPPRRIAVLLGVVGVVGLISSFAYYELNPPNESNASGGNGGGRSNPSGSSSSPTATNTSPNSGNTQTLGPSPSVSSNYSPIYQNKTVTIPPGSCSGATVLVLRDAPGPKVMPGVATLLNDPSQWDLQVDDCAKSAETFKSTGSALTTEVTSVKTPEDCLQEISSNPVGEPGLPVTKPLGMCFQTKGGVVVLLRITSIGPQSGNFRGVVSAWTPLNP